MNLARLAATGMVFCGISAVAILMASLASAAEPRSATAKDVSLCDVVNNPREFDTTLVRFRANYESDGFDGHSSLTSPSCPGIGMGPWIARYPDSLAEALKTGGMGMSDKTISATWVGVFHYAPDEPQRSGKLRRWLEVRTVTD